MCVMYIYILYYIIATDANRQKINYFIFTAEGKIIDLFPAEKKNKK